MSPTPEEDPLYVPVTAITDHKGAPGQVIISSKAMKDPYSMTVEISALALSGDMLHTA